MVLVLKNDQMENLLPMAEEIDAIESAFRELGQGKAMNAPRARLRTPWKEEGGQYYFNNIMGLVPGMKSMALRIDSSFSKEVQVAGSKRRVYPGDFIGLQQEVAGKPEGELREYGIGAQILAELGVHDMILLTNSPRNVVGIEGYHLRVVDERPIPAAASPDRVASAPARS